MNSFVQEENSESCIPASQRPDGTWRKARRVKEGYVPQEEVPLYESKGKKFLNSQQQAAMKLEGYTSHRTIPGLFIESKPLKAPKRRDNAQETLDRTTRDLAKLKLTNDNSYQKSNTPEPATDPAKKLKNLKKRLREVEALEEKIKSGNLVNPEPEQLVKLGRKMELILQIEELEA